MLQKCEKCYHNSQDAQYLGCVIDYITRIPIRYPYNNTCEDCYWYIEYPLNKDNNDIESLKSETNKLN